MSAAVDVCLHCGQSREEVKRNQTYCATLTSGEYIEVDAEWERHRWADWSDADLRRSGIREEAFEKHRRSSVFDLQWAGCEDTVRGHAPSDGSAEHREVFGTVKGQCTLCGKKDVG